MTDELEEEFQKKFKAEKGEEDEDLGGLLDDGDGEGNAEEKAMYERKEEEAREEIQEMFGETIEELEKIKKSMIGFIDKRPKFIAGKYRIEIEEEQLNSLNKMELLNEVMQKSNIYLTEYSSMNEEVTPKFNYIKNLIVKFQEALMNEQGRRFAIIHAEKYNKFFITKNIVDSYLKPIHIWLSRIIGSLGPVGDYIVIVPPGRERPSMGGGDFGEDGFDNGTGFGGDEYTNSYDWWNKGSSNNNIYRRGTKVKPLREFGDKHTK